jgi:hypothetical protein
MKKLLTLMIVLCGLESSLQAQTEVIGSTDFAEEYPVFYQYLEPISMSEDTVWQYFQAPLQGQPTFQFKFMLGEWIGEEYIPDPDMTVKLNVRLYSYSKSRAVEEIQLVLSEENQFHTPAEIQAAAWTEISFSEYITDGCIYRIEFGADDPGDVISTAFFTDDENWGFYTAGYMILNGESHNGPNFGSDTVDPYSDVCFDWVIYEGEDPCRMDSNDNGAIDAGDLIAFLSIFAAPCPWQSCKCWEYNGDFNGDSNIDVGDLLMFIEEFGGFCE